MASALRGAATCGRCDAAMVAGQVVCARCGVRLEPIAAGSALARRRGPLQGVVPARGSARRAAVAVDLGAAVVVAVALGVGTVLVTGTPAHGLDLAVLVGVVALLAGVAVHVATVRASGRTLGRVVTGLRTVDALDGLPPKAPLPAAVAVLTGRGATVVTADLGAGRDPRALLLERVTTSVDPALDLDFDPGTPLPAAPVPTDATAVRLVFESGDELVVDGPVLLGRAPEPMRGVQRLHAVADLSRGIARTHLLADWSDGLLWITDLGSPGGTTVRSDVDVFQPLVPEVRTAVAPGWQLQLGGRMLTVRSLAIEEGVARGR